MKRIYISIMALAAVLPSMAQDTYESAKLLGSDLNGTARYVGMGGAMEALGADISTISSNPAGVGLFRHSMISTSMGIVSQQDAKKFDDVGIPTSASTSWASSIPTRRVSGRLSTSA